MRNLPRMSREGILSRDIWNNNIAPLLESNFRELALQPGDGYDFSRSNGGTSLRIKSGNGGYVAPSTHPFKCTLIPQTSNGSPAGNKVAVEYESTLFKSLIPLVKVSSITGLFDPDTTSSGYPVYLDLDGPDNTTGYTSPNNKPDDYVFLDIKFQSDGVTIDTVSIETKGNGSSVNPDKSPWDSSGNALVSHNTAHPPVQTYARIVLAEYQDGSLNQLIRGNLVMQNMVFNGQPALYPVPY